MAAKISPIPAGARKGSPKRKPGPKVPSWHLTGKKTMQYVKEANTRSQVKKEKADKEDKVKKEAVDKHRANERASKKTSAKRK